MHDIEVFRRFIHIFINFECKNEFLKQLQVNDHYTWLETNSSQTKDFIDDENNLTTLFLEKSGIRNKVKEKLDFFYDNTIYKAGERYGKYYFSFKNT